MNTESFNPVTVPQLADAIEQCFDCVAGEPYAYTRDPPLLRGSDQVTTAWLDQMAHRHRKAFNLEHESTASDEAREQAKTERALIEHELAVNGATVQAGPHASHWRRDQPPLGFIEGEPRYWYFVLAIGDEETNPERYVRALWAKFRKLHAATGQARPRLLWRKRMSFESRLDLDTRKVNHVIRARLAIPCLAGEDGVLPPSLRQAVAVKKEGSAPEPLSP